jgi:hypothetical protein
MKALVVSSTTVLVCLTILIRSSFGQVGGFQCQDPITGCGGSYQCQGEAGACENPGQLQPQGYDQTGYPTSWCALGVGACAETINTVECSYVYWATKNGDTCTNSIPNCEPLTIDTSECPAPPKP